MLNAMPQLVTRIDPELAAAVDGLIARGVVTNRSEAVRLGLEQLVERVRRTEIGTRIVEGYQRIPQSEEELERATQSLQALLDEESW